jgi:hypothetical protein
MAARLWEPGRRFTRLVLVEQVQSAHTDRQLWKCDCDCGTKGYEARADKLQDGRIKSCGCLRAERIQQARDIKLQKKAEQDAIVETLRLKKEALRHKKETAALEDLKPRHEILKTIMRGDVCFDSNDPLFSLNYYAAILADNECHYCHGPLDRGISLDLIDSDRGVYRADNVIPACWSCIEHRRNVFGDRLSFEEMELLGGTLELIRLQRELNPPPKPEPVPELPELYPELFN